MKLGRRQFVVGVGAGLLVPASGIAQESGCALTESDVEGPYYRAGAPLRSDLASPELEGERLVVRGVVRGADCEPLGGALLDVWQADAAGHYDNDGSAGHDARSLVLRGCVRADARGRYEFRSIVPGRYLDGRRYRPAHIHVKVAAPGRRALTTQLYFAGDPYNASDRFFGPTRVLRPERERDRLAAEFDFTL